MPLALRLSEGLGVNVATLINMHRFSELADRSAAFTLNALSEAQTRVVEALQESGATSHVKSLQMVQLQKVISAVGMFSIFEAMLQDRLNCPDGFRRAAEVLTQQGNLVDSQYDSLKAI